MGAPSPHSYRSGSSVASRPWRASPFHACESAYLPSVSAIARVRVERLDVRGELVDDEVLARVEVGCLLGRPVIPFAQK